MDHANGHDRTKTAQRLAVAPLAVETGGRPADITVAIIQTYGQNLDSKERSEVIARTWQQYSTLLAIGNAEMILSAIG